MKPFRVGYIENGTAYWLSTHGSEYITEEFINAATFTSFEQAQPIMARETDLRWFTEMTIDNKVHRFFSQEEMLAQKELTHA